MDPITIVGILVNNANKIIFKKKQILKPKRTQRPTPEKTINTKTYTSQNKKN